jgi:glyoxylase-like metal-dependent hydrolase (beta-lactamase superfamily II)
MNGAVKAAPAAVFLLLSQWSSAQSPAPLGLPQASAPKLTIHEIAKDKVYWAEGGGGNSAIIVGDKGVILVDAKTTPAAGRALTEAAAAISGKPVTHVVLTHSDGDHVNGLAGMPDGLTIIAHPRNRAELLATYQFAAVEVDGGRCLPPSDRLPNALVNMARYATRIDGVQIVFHHFGPAHTGGDIVIELPEHDIAFVGDLITSSVLVHPEKSGRLDGWFYNADRLLKLKVNHFLGGHSSQLDTKDSLRRRMSEYASVKAQVDPMVDAGQSLESIKAAMKVPAKPASGCRGIPYPSLPEVEFHERYEFVNDIRNK